MLKPNLLKKAEVDKAVITHPTVVGMFARLMREKGYQDMALADSCGNGTTSKVIHGTGMDTYLEKLDIPAIDYTTGIHVDYPKGIQAKEIYFAERTSGKRLCDLSLQNEDACTGTHHGSCEKQLWIRLWISQSQRSYIVPKCRQFCPYACRSESVCEAAAVYYGWNCGHGGERTRFRRSCSNECDADVTGSGCT